MKKMEFIMIKKYRKQIILLMLFGSGCCLQAAITNPQGQLQQTFGQKGISKISPLIGSAVGCEENTLVSLKAVNATTLFGGGYLESSGVQYCFVAKFTSAGALSDSNYLPYSIGGYGDTNIVSVEIASDGNLIGCGNTVTSPGKRFMITRFLANNAGMPLDISFGMNGITIIGNSISGGNFDSCTCSVLQPDGKIIMGGSTSSNGGTNNKFALARVLSNGYQDTSFGTNGVAYVTPYIISLGSNDEANAVGLQSDGKIILAGTSTAGDGKKYFSAVRFLSNGTLDTTFGTSGKVTIPLIISGGLLNSCTCMVIQSDDSIVLGGWAANSNNTATFFALARLTPQGAVDTTFGPYGTGTVYATATINGGTEDLAKSLVEDNYGNLILGGTSNNRFAYMCCTSNGILNTKFGVNGFKGLSLLSGVGQDNFLTEAIILGGQNSYIISGGTIDDGDNVSIGLTMLNNTPLTLPDSSPVPTTILSPAQLVSVQTNAAKVLTDAVINKTYGDVSAELENTKYKDFVSLFTTNINNGKSLSEAYDAASAVFESKSDDAYIIKNLKNNALSGDVISVSNQVVVKFNPFLFFIVIAEKNLNSFSQRNNPLPYACALYVAGYVSLMVEVGVLGL